MCFLVKGKVTYWRKQVVSIRAPQRNSCFQVRSRERTKWGWEILCPRRRKCAEIGDAARFKGHRPNWTVPIAENHVSN